MNSRRPPAIDLPDFALEDFFWQCIADGRVDITAEEAGVALLAASDDIDGLLSAASDISDEAKSELDDVLSFLKDPALRSQQEQRAQQIKEHWQDLGKVPPRRKRKRDPSRPPVALLETDEDVEEEEQLSEFDKNEELLEEFAKKRMKHRQILKGLNELSKVGLVKIGGDGLRMNVKGSHMIFHGPGGAHTLVRQHKSSAPLSGQMFLESMRHLSDIAQAPQ